MVYFCSFDFVFVPWLALKVPLFCAPKLEHEGWFRPQRLTSGIMWYLGSSRRFDYHISSSCFSLLHPSGSLGISELIALCLNPGTVVGICIGNSGQLNLSSLFEGIDLVIHWPDLMDEHVTGRLHLKKVFLFLNYITFPGP